MKSTEKNTDVLKNLGFPFIILITFWVIAVVLWQAKDNIFFLYIFGYIGTAIGLGVGLYNMLPRKKKPKGRRLAQFLVGVYMLGFLGLLKQENMQLEGFFFYLLAGMFSGSAIHYLVAKIGGPFLFGRGFCSWACWTAMVLDYLPYKRNKNGRIAAKWELFRYLHFGISLSLVLILWFFYDYNPSTVGNSELVWLIVGNAFYFTSAITIAFALKDNRAFCKYLCPITVVLKITSRFSFFKIEGDQDTCTQCNACVKVCPMDINISKYVKSGERVLSTECINCLTCTTVCPEGILNDTFKLDIGGKEHIRRRHNTLTKQLHKDLT